jgi:hypothetical protein
MELWKLPVAASSILHSPTFEVMPSRQCRLTILVESEEYEVQKIVLNFFGVEYYSSTYMSSCDPDMINKSYGRLISISDSSLLIQINSRGNNEKSLSHLAIFFDDGPLYEFVCKEFSTE